MPEGAGARVPAVLGLDLGTSEAKAALVGLDGTLLGLGRGAYPTDIDADGRAEQDPRDWWAAFGVAVRSLAPALAGAEVLAIACVGQGPTLVAADEAGDPVRPAVTWQDRRSGSGGFGLLPRMAWLAEADPAGVGRCALAARQLGRRRAVAERRGDDDAPGPRGPDRCLRAARGRRGAGDRAGAHAVRAPLGPASTGCRSRDGPAGGHPGRRRGERRDGVDAGRGAARGRRRGRHGRDVGRARDLRGSSRRGARACSPHPPRSPGAGSSAGRWRPSAHRSTGCAAPSWVGDGPATSSSRRPVRSPRARTGWCSCRTWPASGRRSSTTTHGARSSG